MPPRYARRKHRRKRTLRRKRKKWRKKGGSHNKNSWLKLYRPSALPDSIFVKLKYVEYITMTNTAGRGQYAFALNGLFDPNLTGVGHQPMAFDQWAQFYNRYEVLSSGIRCQVLANLNNIVGFTIYPSNTSTPIPAYATAREQPYASSRWVVNAATSGYSFCKNYMRVRKLEGRSVDSLNFTAPVTANPVNLRYWHLHLESTTSSDISAIVIDTKITYYVRFYHRNDLSTS